MKTSTTISLLIIAVIIIGAGAYVMSHRGQDDEAINIHANPTSEPSSSPSGVLVQQAPSITPDVMAAENPVVEMTDAGIVPNAITVKSGTTITFKNTGTSPHWPASDPHPIHTDLPGFDSKHALAPGDFYRFTFVKVGTFGMHDHLHAAFHATITVQ
ncbi:MAG: cupredoxin domain-containing protein [Candidatus Andersenbacteria bacterium]|nr:cupredoxin domain-containing protein [Candidatus Andersenbacteria bacterium]